MCHFVLIFKSLTDYVYFLITTGDGNNASQYEMLYGPYIEEGNE